MLEKEIAGRRPSSIELHAWARTERGRAIALAIGGASRSLAAKLRLIARAGDRLARSVLAAAYRRGAVRALQRLDDGTLADMGVPRCEIESTVRRGRSVRTIQKVERRQQNWQYFPPQWQAAMRNLPQTRSPRVTEPAA